MKRREDKTVPAAEKNADGSLLRTYFVSLFSCLVCCIMFLGTSYAWFTGNVTSASNQIRTGMFQVQLIHEGVDIVEDPSHTVFSSKELAPGSNVIEEKLTLNNRGDIRFRYQMNLDIVDNPDNIAQYFTLETSADGKNWSDGVALTDGVEVCREALDAKAQAVIYIRLVLDTKNLSANAIQGKELVVALCLQVQQTLSDGGDA